MHKVSVFFLMLLLPFNVFATECSTNDSVCISYNGCEINDYGMGGILCEACNSGYYNNSTENSTSCKSCETDYDFNTLTTGKQWDSTNSSEGNTECPWICTDNWYKSGDECSHCPTNSTSAAGSTSISDCQCNNGYYMGGANDDTCYQCPEHANNCTTTGRTYSDITCGDGYTASINTTTHTVSCQSCSDANAINNGGTCYCNVGYYGTPNGLSTSCTACPAGTTTSSAGATSDADCHMTSNTKFYDSTGENYMLLIPSTATNIQ